MVSTSALLSVIESKAKIKDTRRLYDKDRPDMVCYTEPVVNLFRPVSRSRRIGRVHANNVN